jgi:hypothetical protein
MTKKNRDLRASQKAQQSSFMGEKMWDNLQPQNLTFDGHAPETGEIPRAYLRRWRCRSKPAFSQDRTRPGKVGGRARRPRKGVPARVVIEDSSPSLSSAHGFGNFGQVCHSAAVWLLQFGVEQPQHYDVNTMMITYGLNDWFNGLPPGRSNRHS